MRALFVLPGLHRVPRGAEVAFESIAHELALRGPDVTAIGSGQPIDGRAYSFLHANVRPREHFERFPQLPPVLRNEYVYEELTFIPNLLRAYDPADYDVTVTCSYPYTNWAMRMRGGRRRPRHVYVTQNGDWPSIAGHREYRFFGCDGLVCTNPDFFERNAERRRCALIPNGVDPSRFFPGSGERERFGLPEDRQVVLMVSALATNKRVLDGIRSVAEVPDLFLAVAGDGPLREQTQQLADELLPGRFRQFTVPTTDMPALYRSADVFLHMTEFESFGNVYIEAQASGLPVVAHDSRATRWIFGDSARLLNTRRSTDVVEGLKQALNTAEHDRTAAADACVERFAWSRIAAQYHAFLTEVIAS